MKTANVRLTRKCPGVYETACGRFRTFNDEGQWHFIDTAWDAHPCETVHALWVVRQLIAETLDRPNEGRPE